MKEAFEVFALAHPVQVIINVAAVLGFIGAFIADIRGGKQ
jgi:hypothetical protein